MGTWATGNFDSDGALDYLATVMTGFTTIVTACLKDTSRAALDEDGESVLMPTVAIILSLLEYCKAAPPEPNLVADWSEKYLQIFDEQIDYLEPALGYKEARRQVIETTFQQLQAQAERFWDKPDGA